MCWINQTFYTFYLVIRVFNDAGSTTYIILILDFHRRINIVFWFWSICTVCDVQEPQNQKTILGLCNDQRQMTEFLWTFSLEVTVKNVRLCNLVILTFGFLVAEENTDHRRLHNISPAHVVENEIMFNNTNQSYKSLLFKLWVSQGSNYEKQRVLDYIDVLRQWISHTRTHAYARRSLCGIMTELAR